MVFLFFSAELAPFGASVFYCLPIRLSMPTHILSPQIKTFYDGDVRPRPQTIVVPGRCGSVVTIRASLPTSDHIMALLMLQDALDREGVLFEKECRLQIGYFPYSRQDRVSNPGEALSVRVMANLINDMSFNDVQVLDPHSDVTAAVLDNCTVIPAHEPVTWAGSLHLKALLRTATLIAPDAGAAKKTRLFAQAVGNYREILQAGKRRCTTTGRITGTCLFDDQPAEAVPAQRDFVIVDDICVGGRTFTELAMVVRRRYNVRQLHLHVSHGVFSKGVDHLFEWFDTISTTDSVDQERHHHLPALEVLSAFPVE